MIETYVMSTGKFIIEPATVYKNNCLINVEYFPFDVQECFFKFSSWAYDGIEAIDYDKISRKSAGNLQHVCEEDKRIRANNHTSIPVEFDLFEYSEKVEWDIINITATRKMKFCSCCHIIPYPDIAFWIHIHRKTLFYTANLTMHINIDCSCHFLFVLLLSDINPLTSMVIPLIGKYLLFTIIFLTVYTLGVHFRSPATHKMTLWTRKLFIGILPNILYIKRPDQEDKNSCDKQMTGN
ncbi:ACH1-like protein [Mya arenaria]|uniref:ACH1-like protein n=1 Tax=Mya arenaria TaxID=6604 RepID=A0ABY7DLV8_MYAAR|nr:ACH1-like protein [Mya arenaria]